MDNFKDKDIVVILSHISPIVHIRCQIKGIGEARFRHSNREKRREGNWREGSHALDGLGDIVIFSVTDVMIDAAWLIITGFVVVAAT